MKRKLYNVVICISVLGLVIFFTIPFQACKSGSHDVKHDTIIKRDTIVRHDTTIKHDTIIRHNNNNNSNNTNNNYNNNYNGNHNEHKAYKPNIYLYPEKEIPLMVSISFPKGGAVVKSMPEYNDGWNVNVDSTGKINKTYNYLFYESTQPDDWQYKSGWLIAKDSLLFFFQNNMADYGFNSMEIKDYTDYWIPRFTKYKYYLIYPQEKNMVDNLIEVRYSVKPDNIFRLFYAVKGTNDKIKIDKPVIKTKCKRTGFYVTEWGVIIK